MDVILSPCLPGVWGAEGDRRGGSRSQGSQDPGWFGLHAWNAEQTHEEVFRWLEDESIPCQVWKLKIRLCWQSRNESVTYDIVTWFSLHRCTELCSWSPPCWCWTSQRTTSTSMRSSGSTSNVALFSLKAAQGCANPGCYFHVFKKGLRNNANFSSFSS